MSKVPASPLGCVAAWLLDYLLIAFWIAVGYGVVYALVLLYLATLFFGSQHRTVYDRLAGSIVIPTGPRGIGSSRRPSA